MGVSESHAILVVEDDPHLSEMLSTYLHLQGYRVFTADAGVAAVASLLIIGPMGGLVSVYALLRVEPLTALGLAQ